jgi:hypothetical protein
MSHRLSDKPHSINDDEQCFKIEEITDGGTMISFTKDGLYYLQFIPHHMLNTDQRFPPQYKEYIKNKYGVECFIKKTDNESKKK